MSDTQASPRYPADAGERLVKLETIVEETRRTLERVEATMIGLRSDMSAGLISARSDTSSVRSEMAAFRSDMTAEFRDVRAAARAHFYWTLAGMAGLLGAIAKGFGWLH